MSVQDSSDGAGQGDTGRRGAGRDEPGRPTDAVSVCAFVASLLGAGLVAVPLATWGLTRTGPEARRGRGLAVAALAVSVAWVVVALVLVYRPVVLGSHTIAAAVRGGATPSTPAVVVPSRQTPTSAPSPEEVDQRVETVYWEELEAGTCLRVPADDAVDIPVVDCRAEHDEEVLARSELSGPDAWPGDAAVEASADRRCREAFADHIGIGYDDSVLELGFWTNDAEGWAQGGRTLVCLVHDPSTPTSTEALAGAAR